MVLTIRDSSTRVYAIALYLIVGSASVAGAQETAVGIKAGFNIANLQYEGEDANVKLDRRTGFVGGLFLIRSLNTRTGVQLEALYVQKGASFGLAGFKGKAKIGFVDVPILLRASTTQRGKVSVHAFGGPSVGFRVSAGSRLLIEGESLRVHISDKIKRLDIGLVVGAGIDVGRVMIDGRYSWGLTDLNDDPGEEVTIKNRVVSAMAGVRF